MVLFTNVALTTKVRIKLLKTFFFNDVGKSHPDARALFVCDFGGNCKALMKN